MYHILVQEWTKLRVTISAVKFYKFSIIDILLLYKRILSSLEGMSVEVRDLTAIQLALHEISNTTDLRTPLF